MLYRGFAIILIGALLLSTGLIMGNAESSADLATGQTVFQNDVTPTPVPDDDHDDGDEHMADEADYTPEMVEAGQLLFTQYACFACHGGIGQGTDLAPALVNHSPASVRRQVRMPTDNMPVFLPSVLSNDDVDLLIAFISTLEVEEGDPVGENEHAHGGNSIGDLMIEHHRLAHDAMVAENYDEVGHQINHIIAITTGPHQAFMQGILVQIDDGDYDMAMVSLEGMLEGVEIEELDTHIAHLQMALAWVISEDTENATHHLEHVIERSEDEHLHEAVEAIITHLEAEDWHEAEEALINLIPNAEVEHDEHMEEGGDHAEDEVSHAEEGDDHAEEDEHVEENTHSD